MMFAPPGNPSSVGLAEAYVKLVWKGLQAWIQQDSQLMYQWNKILPAWFMASMPASYDSNGSPPRNFC